MMLILIGTIEIFIFLGGFFHPFMNHSNISVLSHKLGLHYAFKFWAMGKRAKNRKMTMMFTIVMRLLSKN